MARESRLIDMEEQEVKDLKAAIVRWYQEVAPEDHLGTMKGLGDITPPTIPAAVGTPQLYQAAEIARQWDPQLAKIYYDQMVHKGKPHYKAVGA